MEILNENSTLSSSNGATDSIVIVRQLRKQMLCVKAAFINETGQGVNYKAFAESDELKQYTNAARYLRTLDLCSLSQNEKMALFINIYNSLTIHALALHKSSSVLEISEFWRQFGYNIAGYNFSLDDIEHGILRGNRPHPSGIKMFEEEDERLKFSIEKFDPRIHFALVCGAKSCPAIGVYEPGRIDQSLDSATKNFIRQECTTNENSSEVTLSRLFLWYRNDFGNTDEEILRWIMKYCDDHMCRRLRDILATGEIKILYSAYDWQLNSSL